MTDTGAVPAVEATSEPLAKGAVLGRYMVLDRLGQGGMGIVYVAYDPQLDRKIALKLLRPIPRLASRDQARLVREGQAMARLAHPNVVAVYDVGTDGDRVFVAMELVEGETLRKWLSGERSWHAIVAVFLQAGRGLAAAHAAAIVHRDFKPENVLVGADGRARVLDFGLAHAADGVAPTTGPSPYSGGLSSSSVDATFTAVGSLAGTPRYMPPEQLSGERVDARGDQFAFCSALWAALYGEAPYAGDDILTLLRSVREGALRDSPARGAPGWLRPILARGLSSEPGDRYPSMEALIQALERDPAAARRRWLVPVAALAVAAGVVVGTRALGARRAPACPTAEPRLAGIWDDAQRTSVRTAFLATGKLYAEDAFGGASRALDAYSSAWVAMHDDACRATLVRGEQSSELMDLRMACLGERLAGLRALTSQLAHADADVVVKAVQAVDGLAPLAACANATALRSPVQAPTDPAARARIDALRADIADARALRLTTRSADAVALARRIAADARATGYGPLEAEALENEGVVLDMAHDPAGAIASLQEAQLAAVAAHHPSIETLAWIDLVHAHGSDARPGLGRDAARQAHACLERDGANDDRLAQLLQSEGTVADVDGRLDEAIELEKRALEIRERTLPPDHPDIAMALNELGATSTKRDDLDAARAYHERALAIREKAFGPRHPLVAASLGNLANAVVQKGELETAIGLYRRALDIQTDAFGPEDRAVANTYNNLGNVYNDAGKKTEALEYLQRALALRTRLLGPEHPDVGKSYGNIAVVYNDMGRWDDAIDYAQRRVELDERTNGPGYPPLARPLLQLGRAYQGKKQSARALPFLERALRLGESSQLSPDVLANVRFTLAVVLRQTHGDAARVKELAAKARAEYVREGELHNVADIDREFPPDR